MEELIHPLPHLPERALLSALGHKAAQLSPGVQDTGSLLLLWAPWRIYQNQPHFLLCTCWMEGPGKIHIDNGDCFSLWWRLLPVVSVVQVPKESMLSFTWSSSSFSPFHLHHSGQVETHKDSKFHAGLRWQLPSSLCTNSYLSRVPRPAVPKFSPLLAGFFPKTCLSSCRPVSGGSAFPKGRSRSHFGSSWGCHPHLNLPIRSIDKQHNHCMQRAFRTS